MVSGLLLVDKPEGITSHDVVARVRRYFNMKSVGHAGTLDPMASGLMVVLLGNATKLSDYLLNGDKGYELTAQLGIKTDSLDITGEILEKKVVDVSMEQIHDVVEKLKGDLELPIPMFSAKKLNGKKLYEYARKGEEVEVPKKTMKFFDFGGLNIEPDKVSVGLKCSKGSFIRAWAAELGDQLGTGAALSKLRRTYSAPYSLSQGLPLSEIGERLSECGDEIQSSDAKELLGQAFLSMGEVLSGWPGLTVKGKDERLLSNGQVPSDLEKRLIYEQKKANSQGEGTRVRIHSGDDGELIALLEVRPCKPLKIKRIFKR